MTETSADNETVRKVFDERAKRLSSRTEALERKESHVAVLVFQVAGERHGIALEKISTVLPAQRLEGVPGAAPEVLGIIPVQGEANVVLKLSRLLGLPSAAESKLDAGYVVLIKNQNAKVGLWVEALGSVEWIERASEIGAKTAEGAIGRAYLKPEAADALFFVDADSIFDHAVFQES